MRRLPVMAESKWECRADRRESTSRKAREVAHPSVISLAARPTAGVILRRRCGQPPLDALILRQHCTQLLVITNVEPPLALGIYTVFIYNESTELFQDGR